MPANAQQSALLSLLHTMLLVATSPGYGNASDTAMTHWFTFISMVWGDPSPLYYPTDWVLACFAVWLSMVYVKADNSPLAAGSVKVYLYGVKKFYSLCNVVVDPKAASSPMTNAVLSAIKKFSDPVKRAMPITGEIIYHIASLPLQSWDDETFQLACLLGFFFLLRVGEFAETANYPSGGGGARHLTMGDLEFFDANNDPITIGSEADVLRARWLHLKVKASKGDQMGWGASASPRRQDASTASCSALLALFSLRDAAGSFTPNLCSSAAQAPWPRTTGSDRLSRPSLPR